MIRRTRKIKKQIITAASILQWNHKKNLMLTKLAKLPSVWRCFRGCLAMLEDHRRVFRFLGVACLKFLNPNLIILSPRTIWSTRIVSHALSRGNFLFEERWRLQTATQFLCGLWHGSKLYRAPYSVKYSHVKAVYNLPTTAFEKESASFKKKKSLVWKQRFLTRTIRY